MAKAAWLNTTPSTGSGNATVNVSSVAPHTGRVARNTVVTFKAANVTDVPVSVAQAGKPEYADIQDSAASQKAGQTITLSGTSNSKQLRFTLGVGELVVSLPSNYIANSVSTPNGSAIAGDPGASAEYPFSIPITVPANKGITEISRQIIVTDEAGHTDTCLLTQAAGDATLTVNLSSLELTWQGTAKTLSVTSNTNWTIE